MAAGTVTIDGKTYTKRHQVIPLEFTVTAAGVTPINLTLPGIAIFMLRGLTRVVMSGAPLVPDANKRFRFKLGNSDGNNWYSSAPSAPAGTTDRVIDPLIFGTGQFPYVLDPYILYSVSASVRLEVEDITAVFPYTIFFGFQGCWLLP